MPEPLRVCEVVGGLETGGVQSWLVQVLRRLDPVDVHVTVVTHTASPGRYEPDVVAAGHRVVVCPDPRSVVGYLRRFRRLLEAEGPFDAVHCQVGNFSAVPLLAARIAGVPVRIAHSQSDRRSLDSRASLARSGYLRGSRAVIRAAMTLGLGCSDGACRSLFGAGPGEHPPIRLLRNGIDPHVYSRGRAGLLRRELGVGDGTLLVGHLGRFVPEKNHRLLVDVASVWRETGAPVRLVLAGDGPLRRDVERLVAERGLADRVTLLGVREDVPDLLADLDVLLLPSHLEGAPITVLEAQASGTPVVVSAAVDRECAVVPGLVTSMAPTAGAADWAQTALDAAVEPRPSPDRCRSLLAGSSWSLAEVVPTLRRYLAGETGPAR